MSGGHPACVTGSVAGLFALRTSMSTASSSSPRGADLGQSRQSQGGGPVSAVADGISRAASSRPEHHAHLGFARSTSEGARGLPYEHCGSFFHVGCPVSKSGYHNGRDTARQRKIGRVRTSPCGPPDVSCLPSVRNGTGPSRWPLDRGGVAVRCRPAYSSHTGHQARLASE